MRIDSAQALSDTPELHAFCAEGDGADYVIELAFVPELPVPSSPERERGGLKWSCLEGSVKGRGAQTPYAFIGRRERFCRLEVIDDYRGVFDASAVLRTANFYHIMLEFNALVLHASYIISGGRAILFAAPSGTGKSTQALLWEKHRGAEIINGDRCLVRLTDAGCTANGVYYAGTSGICKNVTAPLAAVVLLSRSKENSARSPGGREGFLGLFHQCAYAKAVPHDPQRAAELAADIALRAKLVLLSCTPDERAVVALEEYLRGGKNGGF